MSAWKKESHCKEFPSADVLQQGSGWWGNSEWLMPLGVADALEVLWEMVLHWLLWETCCRSCCFVGVRYECRPELKFPTYDWGPPSEEWGGKQGALELVALEAATRIPGVPVSYLAVQMH